MLDERRTCRRQRGPAEPVIAQRIFVDEQQPQVLRPVMEHLPSPRGAPCARASSWTPGLEALICRTWLRNSCRTRPVDSQANHKCRVTRRLRFLDPPLSRGGKSTARPHARNSRSRSGPAPGMPASNTRGSEGQYSVPVSLALVKRTAGGFRSTFGRVRHCGGVTPQARGRWPSGTKHDIGVPLQ
jgi:hypothetical protein